VHSGCIRADSERRLKTAGILDSGINSSPIGKERCQVRTVNDAVVIEIGGT
jgi:hypothetical protein